VDHEGYATAMMIVTDDADSDILCMDGDHSQQADTTGGAPTTDFVIGSQLTADQAADMRRLLADYNDAFTDRPGRTDLIQHKIQVTNETPTYQPPYRIPESLRDAVYDELMKMLENNVIRYDPDTLWNSPLIVVRKPDGNIRLVNNFIKLNEKTPIYVVTVRRRQSLPIISLGTAPFWAFPGYSAVRYHIGAYTQQMSCTEE